MQILIIDCSNLCYMAHFTSGGLSYEEKKTGVLFGFLRQVFKLVNDFETHKIVFCWDSRKSYRKKINPSYKSNRKREDLTEEEIQDKNQFYSQINNLRRKIIPALGFKNSFIKTGYEADDIIANLVVYTCPGSTVVSTDNDLWQLLDFCTIYNPRTKKRFIIDNFKALYDIEPGEWRSVKAIAGCSGDGVIGIKGIGEITAVRYIKGGKSDTGKLSEKIVSSGSLIDDNHRLVDLPLDPFFLDLDFNENFDLKDWIEVFREYNFKSFMNKSYLNKLKRTFNLTKA
ncbi:MAG: hypothetical protein ABIG69_06425 [Bacteroidota bacterium]